MRTISVEALVLWLESPELPRLVDVLGREHFERVHLPGAENIPRVELAERALKEIGLDEPVVVYCSDRDCSESPRAAAILAELGYREVFNFEAGSPSGGGAACPCCERCVSRTGASDAVRT